ncbi:hypothetical protein BDA96_10G037300 [Sorghum bicolor]|uniref:Uncharacterized protein n=1 Tax=Sorghum bicolor TaxID=4558 RepID=A0A921TZM4_SORBI|nr:hypothetical protein BDA96_10G037300 [Sorghum bicolor]
MSFCGAHLGHTRPLSLVLSKNPSGSSSSRLASVGYAVFEPAGGGPRSTHRKRASAAISRTCGEAKLPPMLPKQSSTTDAGGCASSHLTHSCTCCSCSPPSPDAGGLRARTGPTG